MADPVIERDEVVALLFNVSDIAAASRRWCACYREVTMAKKRKLTKAEREELNALLDRMNANALRTRELAERAQAKLDAERPADG
jgi:hypothetical protein